jgi:hypothetical protein
MKTKILQCKIRISQKKFRTFQTMHGLSDYKDPNKPTFFYGLYRKDVELMKKHKSLLILIWRGSDIMQPGHLEASKKMKTNVKHVAISSFICRDLDMAGIKYIRLPIVGRPVADIRPKPLGDEVYVYLPKTRHDFFNADIIEKIKKKCKYKINIATHINYYSRKKLLKVYERCFCGIRLSNHDGLPNQVIEMGLMGRKCIHNGDLPGSIHWNRSNIDNIINNINNEAKFIGTINKKLYKDTKKLINIGNEWLYTNYWK